MPDATPRPGHRMILGISAAYFGLGILCVVLLSLLITAVALGVIWVGFPLLAAVLAATRRTAMSYRRIVGMLNGVPVESPYRVVESTRLVDRLRGWASDPTTYRDIIWLPIAATLGMAVGITALVLYLIFPLGIWVSPIMVRMFAAFSAVVLQRSDPETMQQRIGELAKSRAETVDTQAAEIRRIERDLHDGAQARLVALSMNLGLAEQLMDKDPNAARDLLTESRDSATTALQDLRRLVRGIHPPVLADRGLVGAIQALALAHPFEVHLDLELPGRPSAPVESACYFAVAEALTNAAKHSNAGYAWVWMRYEADALHIAVGDDGIGGGSITNGGGLQGLQRRLSAFDGVLSMSSPVGGPTIVSIDVPCELSAG